jgi:hypothetical protein
MLVWLRLGAYLLCLGFEDAKLKIHIKDEHIAYFQRSVSSFSTANSN